MTGTALLALRSYNRDPAEMGYGFPQPAQALGAYPVVIGEQYVHITLIAICQFV
jgi:hypothetical protein